MPLAGIALLPVVAWCLFAAEIHWLAAGALVAGAIGFADDRGKARGGGVDWRVKGALLALAAACAATQAADPAAAPWRWAAAFALAFVLANATNFLDNTDGVACALSAVTLLAATGGAGPLAAVGFAALGFLPWNWPRPLLFLGDCGAYALGICAAAAVAARLPDARALLFAAVQLADFAQVTAARLWLRVPPWVGDRRHLTHIARNLGVPRVAVAPLFALIALAAAAAAAGAFTRGA